MATSPGAYLRRIRRDLPATAPEHLDVVTDGMVNDAVVGDRARVSRFGKHDWSQLRMQPKAKVLDLVRAHVDVAVPPLQLLGDDACPYPLRAGTPLTRHALLSGLGPDAPPSTCSTRCWSPATGTSGGSWRTSAPRPATCGRFSALGGDRCPSPPQHRHHLQPHPRP